jgi:hypothetical protein
MSTEMLPTELKISSPGQFRTLLLQLADMLKDGRLKQYFELSPEDGAVDIAGLASLDQWPDTVEAEFVDCDGHHYELFVDCYHGSGGTWRLVRSP